MRHTVHHSVEMRKDNDAEINRRESFRINDRVALLVKPLTDAEYRQARDHIASSQKKQRTLNSIKAGGSNQQGALRRIRDTEPAIANYLQNLEDRLDVLTQLLVHEKHTVPDVATHDVNISGNGIRFPHPQELHEGSYVALELQLFPSQTCISCLGVVVRSTQLQHPSRSGARFTIATDFCDLHNDDRELLISHIQRLQLDHAQRQARFR